VKISPLPTPDVPSPLSTTFTFVNSHLAAFDGMVDRRNADFHDLSRRLVFPLKPSIDNYSVQASVATLSVFECDALFWIVCRLVLNVLSEC
jgi:phosphatidylinositol-bisphosphatase